MIRKEGFAYINGTYYNTYRVLGRWVIHIGGKFPWIHGRKGMPF
jgi:hypothetical protein